jgi:hypothetical protein
MTGIGNQTRFQLLVASPQARPGNGEMGSEFCSLFREQIIAEHSHTIYILVVTYCLKTG